MTDYKKDFPLLKDSQVAYLDNAATAQRPLTVLEAEKNFYEKYNANPLRGLYELGMEATDRYEEARDTVRDFLHAKKSCEIVFTRNTTESINLVAYSYGLNRLKAGDELLVQVEREALKTKEPAVTANLSFAGKYAVLTSGNRRLGISSKLNKEQKAHYKELLHEFDTESYGLIIRTNAASVADETLIAEIRSLEQEWSQMRENVCHKTCYSVLKKARPTYLEDVKNQREGSVSEIITDDRGLFETICTDYGIHPKQFMTNGSVPVPVDQFQMQTAAGAEDFLTITYYHDPMLTLSSLYSVKSSLEKALREQIWLKSGASIVLQHTEALTVIDVNSGKNIIKKEMRENLLRINLEAAKEIAYQLRLRNISGIIIIDFINLLAKEDEAVLLKEFRTYLKDDPVKTDLIDMTRLGLVEVTRKKIKKSLRDSLKMN